MSGHSKVTPFGLPTPVWWVFAVEVELSLVAAALTDVELSLSLVAVAL